MKKLLASFGLLLATGCNQSEPIAVTPPPAVMPDHRLYIVTVDCGTAQCPYDGQRYVFASRNIEDVRARFIEVAHDMTEANPGATTLMANAQFVAYGDALNPGWTPPTPVKVYTWANGSSFTLNIDTSYL